MEWLNIVGGLLAFIGSLIVSSNLVQSRRHTEAQNRTYFNGNPFLSRSYKSNIVGFSLIVIGFAVTLSVDLSSAASLSIPQTFQILSGLFIISILIVIFLFRTNETMYKRLEAERQLTIFTSCIENIKNKFEGIIGQHNEETLFTTYKSGDVANLKKNYDNLNSTQRSEKVKRTYSRIARAKNAQAMVNAASEYSRRK